MDYKAKFLIGTSGWSYQHWKGLFYPRDLPQSKWFEYYTKKFPTVEINATYYRAFNDKIYLHWYEQAPTNFKYVLKAHRIIMHRKKLLGTEINLCWESAALLKEKLGLILLQFSQQSIVDENHLKNILLSFPDARKLAVEFRNHFWLTKEINKLLKSLKVTFCTSDAPEINLLNWVTSKTGYIRLHGYSKNIWYAKRYSKNEIKKIAELAKDMSGLGAKQIYIFFNNDYKGYAPQNALELLDLMGSSLES